MDIWYIQCEKMKMKHMIQQAARVSLNIGERISIQLPLWMIS